MILRKLILITFILFAFAPIPTSIDREQLRTPEIQVDGLKELKLKCYELKSMGEKITILEEETDQIVQRIDDPNELQRIKRKLKEKR